MGRLASDYYVQDGVIPRTKLPEVLRPVIGVGERYGLRIANVFHAGDGNLHPLIMFDGSKGEAEVERVKEAGREILMKCLEVGGSITGEHGVGMEKNCYMPLQYSPVDLATMMRVRDAFDPLGLSNPGKVFPTPSRLQGVLAQCRALNDRPALRPARRCSSVALKRGRPCAFAAAARRITWGPSGRRTSCSRRRDSPGSSITCRRTSR